MKDSKANLIPGVLLIMTSIISALSIDFEEYDWLDITPAILFAIAGIVYFMEFFKKRKEEKQNG